MGNTTEFWNRHVVAIHEEGVAVTVYARRHGLSVASLYYWRQKLLTTDVVSGCSAPSQFVAVHIAQAVPPSGVCTLVLPSGLRLEMSALPSPSRLAALEQSQSGAH